MTLIDTSVWVEYFNRQAISEVEELVAGGEARVCLPIIEEVLQGIREETAYRITRQAILNVDVVESPLRLEVFLEATELYRTARRAGFTIRSSVDCLIAACAIRNDLELLHADRDFPALARIAPLRERSLVRSG